MPRRFSPTGGLHRGLVATSPSAAMMLSLIQRCADVGHLRTAALVEAGDSVLGEQVSITVRNGSTIRAISCQDELIGRLQELV
jgi:hypothetical protein